MQNFGTNGDTLFYQDAGSVNGGARLLGIDTINLLEGNNFLDLTSTTVSLAGNSIQITAGTGDDILWLSDANENVNSGNGNDQITVNGGTDTLATSLGSDIVTISKNSGNLTISDFDISTDKFVFQVASNKVSVSGNQITVDNIDPIFELSGEFLIAFDRRKKSSSIGNSSVFRFEAGVHHDIYENFNNNSSKILNIFRNEQAYLSDMLVKKGIFQYLPEDWCPSFKYHCVPNFPLNYFLSPKIPMGAKIILFHGLPEPAEAAEGKSGKWYRYIKKSPWINEHWLIS